MKIKHICIYTYQIPLNRILNINNRVIESRQGIIIRLTDEQGNEGIGEIAPLPGLHQESYADTLNQIKMISHKLKDMDQIGVKGLFNSIGQIEGIRYCYPSVRFGIESAIVNLVMISKQDSSHLVSNEPLRNQITVNALVEGNPGTLLNMVSQKLTENFKCIKLKVGRDAIGKDIDLVKSVDKIIKNKATLRLDANRAWDIKTTINFINAIKDCHIEYIEEPLKNPSHLSDLEKQADIPLALDESITDTSFDFDKSDLRIKALVIKPTLIGSLGKTFQLLNYAKKTGLTAVISDTYSSGIGLSFLVWLASFVDKDTPMGFDTYPCLSSDILLEKHSMIDAKIEVNKSINRARRLNWSMLIEYFVI
jgi:o-succinylbenzoate synthase